MESLKEIDVAAVFTLSSETALTVLQRVTPFTAEIYVESKRHKYAVIESVSQLHRSRFDFSVASACLCRKENYVLVWCNNVQRLYSHIHDVEVGLIEVVG